MIKKRRVFQVAKEFNISIEALTNFLESLNFTVGSRMSQVTEEMFESHRKASPIMHEITKDAFDEIGRRIQANEEVTEYDIHRFMQKKYRENGLTTDMSPIVGVNEHAADPHYVPTKNTASVIKKGDLVLIDSWAKFNETVVI